MIHISGSSERSTGLIMVEPYRMRRITGFLDPFTNSKTSGFQTVQSLLALGSGGLFGVGLGNSGQKFLYLPERHTDFIFAVIGEEGGFIASVAVLALFFLIVKRRSCGSKGIFS